MLLLAFGSLGLLGCVDGGGSLFGAAVLGLAWFAIGCDASSGETCSDNAVCIDGIKSIRHQCCPADADCNFGMIRVRTCDDGSCINETGDTRCPEDPRLSGTGGSGSQQCEAAGNASCPDDPQDSGIGDASTQLCEGTDPNCVANCSGHLQKACEDGVIVQACCPLGTACNYGLGWDACGPGRCSTTGCDDAGS